MREQNLSSHERQSFTVSTPVDYLWHDIAQMYPDLAATIEANRASPLRDEQIVNSYTLLTEGYNLMNDGIYAFKEALCTDSQSQSIADFLYKNSSQLYIDFVLLQQTLADTSRLGGIDKRYWTVCMTQSQSNQEALYQQSSIQKTYLGNPVIGSILANSVSSLRTSNTGRRVLHPVMVTQADMTTMATSMHDFWRAFNSSIPYPKMVKGEHGRDTRATYFNSKTRDRGIIKTEYLGAHPSLFLNTFRNEVDNPMKIRIDMSRGGQAHVHYGRHDADKIAEVSKEQMKHSDKHCPSICELINSQYFVAMLQSLAMLRSSYYGVRNSESKFTDHSSFGMPLSPKDYDAGVNQISNKLFYII